MLKALAGSSWGQDKETLLVTYNALGKSIANYAAPVWNTNASELLEDTDSAECGFEDGARCPQDGQY